jgi:hypothetical protein
LKKVAKAMWMEYLFISRKIPELGIVPPGFAPLASAITAYLAGRPNQLPRLYYPETGSNGKFRVSADVFIELQRLRKQAQSIK